MTYRGQVKKGVIVLDDSVELAEGTPVEVTTLPARPEELPTGEEEVATLYERMRSAAGKAKGLPPDLAVNHDHYLHGQAKR